MDKHLARRFPHYSKLLRLYPETYRKRYGNEMMQTLADMLDYAESAAERRRIWGRTVLDLPLAAAQQQLITIGETMHESPFIKRNFIISTLLLLPFFAAIAANGADKAFRNQTLYHSGLWSMPWLGLWVLYLPLLAGAIAVVSIVVALVHNHKISVAGIWPLIGVLVIALGIASMALFHDSTHCVTGNPVRELRNARATLTCIAQR